MKNRSRMEIGGIISSVDEALFRIRRAQLGVSRGEWGTLQIEDSLIEIKKNIEIASVQLRRISTTML